MAWPTAASHTISLLNNLRPSTRLPITKTLSSTDGSRAHTLPLVPTARCTAPTRSRSTTRRLKRREARSVRAARTSSRRARICATTEIARSLAPGLGLPTGSRPLEAAPSARRPRRPTSPPCRARASTTTTRFTSRSWPRARGARACRARRRR